MGSVKRNRIPLSDLAFATFIYASASRYDASLSYLWDQIGHNLDLSNTYHIEYVLAWLRKWKCRNLEIQHEGVACESIRDWYLQSRTLINALPDELSLFMDDDLNTLSDVFGKLADNKATPKKRIGSTAAAKILYLLKPGALPPWDNLIRNELHYNGSGRSYAAFIKDCQSIEKDILKNCQRMHVAFSDLVRHGRPQQISIAKAIDEFYWTTITSGIKIPSPQHYETWLRLSTQSDD